MQISVGEANGTRMQVIENYLKKTGGENNMDRHQETNNERVDQDVKRPRPLGRERMRDRMKIIQEKHRQQDENFMACPIMDTWRFAQAHDLSFKPRPTLYSRPDGFHKSPCNRRLHPERCGLKTTTWNHVAVKGST